MTEARPSDRTLHPLRGELVYLRPSERSDLERFVAWLSDAETARHLLLRTPISMAMEDQWFETMLAAQGKTDYHFVICRLSDDEPIGATDLRDIDYLNGSAEFGIVIGEKAEWSKGYGTDALNAICDFGFGELRLERIALEVFASNTRARRSYEKAGFTLEGIFRHRHYSEGRFEDVMFMSLLRDEWLAQPRKRSWELNELG